eukprot:1439334-Rhodomonas_salina.1
MLHFGYGCIGGQYSKSLLCQYRRTHTTHTMSTGQYHTVPDNQVVSEGQYSKSHVSADQYQTMLHSENKVAREGQYSKSLSLISPFTSVSGSRCIRYLSTAHRRAAYAIPVPHTA